MRGRTLRGWGGFLKGRTLAYPYRGRVEGQGIPRGLGRSYGDASFCEGGHTWLMRGHNQLVKWEDSLFIAQAGMTLYEVIRHTLPAGWFPPVVPGTQFVTLGGAFASSIHGKNHHVAGSFAEHVEWIELRLPSGALEKLTPHHDLFWATAGGMGLTGIIETVALHLQRIPSGFIEELLIKAQDWDVLLDTLKSQESRYSYAVAWIDHTHPRHRGIIHLGEFAAKGELKAASKSWIGIPFRPPFSLLNKWTVQMIAEFYWQKHRAGTHHIFYDTFFFPLDRIRRWDRLWGRKGFVQFQFIVPTEEGLDRVWSRLREAPARSFLTVLKRLRHQRGPLAFSGPGWTIAIDLPATEEVQRFLIRLTDVVIEEKGRIYLTKDSLLLPEQARAAYPEWESFQALKAVIDPEQRLVSNLSRRLRLTL